MNLPKFRVAILIIVHLILRTCLAGFIIKTSEAEESSKIIEAAVKILRLCDRMRVATIGIAGDSSDCLIGSLSSEESFSVILIDDTSRSVNNGPPTRIFQYKLQTFVITTSSATELKRILMELKNSRWWNHAGQFYILDSSVKESKCSEAHEILWTAWKINLLGAKFLCFHRTKGRLIYSFNPYKIDAPKPWQLETIHRGKNNHPWALLVREYRENEEICENMDFDTTKDLGGYEIRYAARGKTTINIEANVNNAEFNGRIHRTPAGVIQSLSKALNATAKLIINQENESVGFVDDEGNVHGFLEKTVNGMSDMDLIGRLLILGKRVVFTYPYRESGLTVMTQYKGDKSQLRKILSVLDVRSRLGVCIVVLVTLVVLKYFVRQTPVTAALNVLRIICNGSITNLPRKTAPRICLASLFLFFVTIQGIYQGQLASILARREPLKNINTMQDLSESDHTIYSHIAYNRYFEDRMLLGRNVSIEHYDCTIHVVRDPSAACLSSWSLLATEAARLKLHLPRDNAVKLYAGWIIREDLPLERRININIQRLVEANIIERWLGSEVEKSLRTIEANAIENIDRTVKILNMKDMTFAFAILGIGLGLATISFIVEMIIIGRVRSRIAKTRGRFRNQFQSIKQNIC